MIKLFNELESLKFAAYSVEQRLALAVERLGAIIDSQAAIEDTEKPLDAEPLEAPAVEANEHNPQKAV